MRIEWRGLFGRRRFQAQFGENLNGGRGHYLFEQRAHSGLLLGPGFGRQAAEQRLG